MHRGTLPNVFLFLTLALLPAHVCAQQPDTNDDIDWRHSMTDPGAERPTDADPTPPTTGTDLGARLLQMLLVLAAVCALAYAVLRWGVRGLVGADTDPDGPIHVLARQRIGSERTILVVRVGPRALVLGDTDAGLTRLDTLDGEALDDFLTRLDRDDTDTDTDDHDTDSVSPLPTLWSLGATYPENDVDE